MELFISRAQFLILISAIIIFSTGILTVLSEADSAELNLRDQKQREAMLAARAGSTSQFKSAIHLKNDFPIDDSYEINFASAFLNDSASGSYNNISAKWIIPEINVPEGASGDGTWSMLEWIGIGAIGCSEDWICAGIISAVTVSGEATTWQTIPFYQWGSTNSNVPTFNLEVEIGDVVEVLVVATSATEGTFVMTNRSAGTVATTTLSAPDPSSSLCVADVEWILQGPGWDPTYLASFNDWSFQDCHAQTSAGGDIDLLNTHLTNMEDSSGNVLVTASIIDCCHALGWAE